MKCRYYSDEIHENAFMPKSMYRRLMDRKLDW
jgi:hypothetical protein